MQNIFLPYKNSRICFGILGTGPSVTICLHGFGENKSSFSLLESPLGSEYTFLCLDLPFHGETEWNEGLLFSAKDFLAVIDKAFQEIGLEMGHSFSILSFSLGGRLALWLLEKIPARINRAILLAPDGLHVNFWYWLGTQTLLGNKLFYATMLKPAWFFTLIKIAGNVGMLNTSIIKLVHYYLDDKVGRLLLYKRWTALRKFKPDLQLSKKNIISYNIPVRLVFGSYDQIILEKRSDFFKNNNNNVKVTVLDAGHQLLKEKYITHIIQQFSN